MNAMKRTGPISTYRVYENLRVKGTTDAYGKSIMDADDPYWQQFFERNYRLTDRYKYPSSMAWDHKEYGIVGEIFDMKKLEKRMRDDDKNHL